MIVTNALVKNLVEYFDSSIHAQYRRAQLLLLGSVLNSSRFSPLRLLCIVMYRELIGMLVRVRDTEMELKLVLISSGIISEHFYLSMTFNQ
jgi:hypothetical protein